MTALIVFLSGGVTMAYVIGGVFFLRFWRRARESLFLCFAIAFWLLALNQGLTGLYGSDSESQVPFYSLRLLGFVLIIIGIVRKNVVRN